MNLPAGHYRPVLFKESEMLTKLKALYWVVADYLWVAQAYLRGKVLKQKGYRPTGILFHLAVPTTAKRITMLFGLWGYRCLTIQELKFIFDYQPSIPYLSWHDGQWELKNDQDAWGSPRHRLIFAR
jgi:hypothetical protein